MTSPLTGDQLKNKPLRTSLSCVLLGDIRQGTSFPAVLSSPSPSSSLRNQVLLFAIEMMNCLRKSQFPKTPSHPELEYLSLYVSFFNFFCFYHKLSSPLCRSFKFCFSPAWREVGTSIPFTSSPHSGQGGLSLHQATQGPTWSQLDKARVLLSKGLISHPKSSSNCPQTPVDFNQSCGHSMWGKQPEWLWQSAPRPCSGHPVLKNSIGCLVFPQTMDICVKLVLEVFILLCVPGKARQDETLKQATKHWSLPKISHL